MEFQKLATTAVMIGIVILCTMGFIVSFQTENNVSTPIGSNPLFNKTFGNLSQNLELYKTQANGSKTAFDTENPTTGIDSLLFKSIISAGKIFNNIIGGVYTVIVVLPSVALGIPTSIMSAIAILLIIAILLGLWSVYKAGR